MPRLFVGIPIDEPCQQQLDTLLVSWREVQPGWRWQWRGNRHLTLAFLGDVNERDVLPLLQVLPREMAPFTLGLSALERFPDARGRIFAATAEASAPLLGVKQQVDTVLAKCGITYAEQGRPLLPHITLARLPASFREALPRQVIAVPLCVSCLHLYVSEVADGQRVYRPLGL